MKLRLKVFVPMIAVQTLMIVLAKTLLGLSLPSLTIGTVIIAVATGVTYVNLTKKSPQ